MSDSADDLYAYVRDELPRIIQMVRDSNVKELKLQAPSAELLIRRASGAIQEADAASAPQASALSEPWHEAGPALRMVAAPMVGTFYHSEQPGRAPLVQEGSHVERGSLIGVIEALQVLTEVESDATGTVQRLVAGDGEPVEFGQPLVEILAEA